jgi:hypothetical protein
MKYNRLFVILIAFSLPFMALLVSGLSIYLININEIGFTLRDIAFQLAGLLFVTSLILYLILYYFRSSTLTSNILKGLIVGISLAVWVQSQFLAWNFGQFNGQPIHWYLWRSHMIIDGLVWLAIVAFALFLFLRRKQNSNRAVVGGIYLLGILSILIAFKTSPSRKTLPVDESLYKGIFKFHPQKNVMIILLDDFQSDYFNDIITKHPDEVKELDGFTFYRNNISRFPTTRTSLPSIITGAIYKNQKGYDDYIKDSYKNFNIFQAYKNKSYSTCFVGQLQSLYPDVISMEDVAYKMNNSWFYPLFEYLDYGFFRAVPTFIKPIIFNKGNWFFTYSLRNKYPPSFHGADVQFVELLDKKASLTENGKGTFKFFHFFIPHPPWRVNENLQFDPNLKGEEGYSKQARGAINLASRVLRTIKRLGIYDQTEIIIMSDHGTGIMGVRDLNNIYENAIRLVPEWVQSSSLALLLHKPANARGKLVISDIPVELTDIACILGLPYNDTICHDYDLAKSGGKRDRTFYYYEWSREYWNTDHMPPIKEYIVSGPSYDPESYKQGKNIYTAKGIQTIPVLGSNAYKLGEEIDFTTKVNGASDPYIREGWNPSESSQRWSDGPISGLSFHLDQTPQKDLVLKILALGYLGNHKIKCQEVNIIVNQIPIGSWLMPTGGWYEAIIPKKLISDGTVNLVFRYSNPMSPKDIENSQDDRVLALGVVKLVMEEKK